MKRARPVSKDGPTFQSLALLYLHGPTSISNLHPWLATAAKQALRRGLVELVVDHDDVIAITGAGRQALGLPAPGALVGRDPIVILEAAMTVAYGFERYALVRPDSAAEGAVLIVRIAGIEVPHRAMHLYLDLTARVAREHGVECSAAFDCAGRFLGFART